MRRLFGLLIGLLVALGAYATSADTTVLKPKTVYGKEARVVSYILSNNHYRKLKLSDSLSSAILDAYLVALDNSKSYFLSSDIASFEKYRNDIDDFISGEKVEVAYDIFNIYKERYLERMNYAMTNLITQEFDYSKDEYYVTDRDTEPWPSSEDELNDQWRKIIMNQALSLKLTGKSHSEIVETLTKRYERFIKQINQFNSEDVFTVFMNAVTEAYDPHTNYFSPKASDLFKQSMSLSLEGIGAQLQTENDYTKVASVVPGGPADKSDKIHANDYIIGVAQGIDGEMVDVIGWRIDDVVKLIKGPKGTSVRLQLLKVETGLNGPSVEIVLVRDKIKLEDQAAKKSIVTYSNGTKELKLGVISLPSFYMDFDAYQRGDRNYRSTTRDVKRLIEELEAENIDGLVVDLRNNGGGSLSEAIDLTGLFIKNGPVVQVRSSNNRVEVGMDDDNGIVYSGPLTVLTNRFSASASEIFAGAIQDYQRGVIVGENTFGKGTVQQVIDLDRFITDSEEVGELKLTLQKFYRVSGSSTQNKGVVPDVILPSAFELSKYGESSYANALPWDVIKGTSFQKTNDVNEKLLSGLNKSHNERMKSDLVLQRYATEMDELKSSLSQTKISLNEGKRKKEMEEAEIKKAANAKLNTKVTSKEGLPQESLESLDDEFLREGLLILTEIITRRIG
ncbi:MAG: carboxy terminal-processing peptidase [Flammeovirgaceae bacterium]|nr:carboxy terminal-processing peptidase [Flammeovirgaceae bacterium]